jgi:7-cyano-7-deazaguanine synthase
MQVNGRADTVPTRERGSYVATPGHGRPAVVLLSGGLDSATVLALAKRDGYSVHALSVRYGQRNANELEAARAVASAQGVEQHLEVAVDLGLFGGSSLTDDIDVPKAASFAERNSDPVPTTYVPARNTIFLSLALAWAETLGADDIFVGIHASNRGGYPDCRPEFVSAFEQLAGVATNRGLEAHTIRIHAPFLSGGWSKSQVIRLGLDLGVDYALTRTCFDPSHHGEACGHCDACLLRQQGFSEAGAEDPAPYAAKGAV